MSVIKRRLLKRANLEADIELSENPFVGKILSTNNVWYFRGLFMKVWADGPFLYKTQKVNKTWTLTYGIGIKRMSDGQEQFRIMNCEWDGVMDEDGFRHYVIPEIYEVSGSFYAKQGSSPDKILIKDPATGEATEVPTYRVDEQMSQQDDGEYLYYYIYSINEPGSGYVDYFDTIGPCEGKKVYLHDEYFQLETEQAASAITRLEFSKEIREIPVGSLMYLYRLQDITLPLKLTQIGANTFAYCIALSGITIPSNVTFIDTSAFAYCTNLTDIYFDNSVTMLPAGVPWGAENAIVRCKDGYYEGEIASSNNSGNNNNEPEDPGYEEPIEEEPPYILQRGDIQNPSELREYIMPDSILEVEEHAFSGCTNVTYLYIGSGFTNSGDYGFEAMADLVNLESIEVSPSNYSYKSPNNSNAVINRYYGSNLYLGCKNTVIPNTVNTVGGFKNTSGLTSITLPNSVTTIEHEAFMNCKDLSAITLSSNLEWINAKAFYGCSNLTQIIIPESVEGIEDYAFEGCSNLTDIQIDNYEGEVEIGSDVFAGCGTDNIRYLKDEESEEEEEEED